MSLLRPLPRYRNAPLSTRNLPVDVPLKVMNTWAELAIRPLEMKKIIFVLILLSSPLSRAAESPILLEIMGKSTYSASGLSQLSNEQLRALENWVLKNAVEKRVATDSDDARVEPQSVVTISPALERSESSSTVSHTETSIRESTTVKETKPRRRFFGFGRKEKAESSDQAPRYVEISKESPANQEDDEPVTQKYVRIELLDDDGRVQIEPDLIRSRIDGPFKGWRNNKTRFKLENGEIWEQRQPSTFITQLDSPQVIIKKRRFGYTMEVPAIGRSVHVKRIK